MSCFLISPVFRLVLLFLLVFAEPDYVPFFPAIVTDDVFHSAFIFVFSATKLARFLVFTVFSIFIFIVSGGSAPICTRLAP